MPARHRIRDQHADAEELSAEGQEPTRQGRTQEAEPWRVGGCAADARAGGAVGRGDRAEGRRHREAERQRRIPREGQRQLLTKGRNMSKSIFLVGGGKGGVGKSLLSMTVDRTSTRLN